MPSAASVEHDFPPAAFPGATSEQHRAQLRSHVPTARLAHFPAAASWSQVYLLLFGVLLEHAGHVPFEQVERHLPEGTMDREEQDVFWETTEQFAVVEGEMSEQKAAWSAGKGVGGAVGVGGEGGGVAVGGGCVVRGGVVGFGGGGCSEVVVVVKIIVAEARERESEFFPSSSEYFVLPFSLSISPRYSLSENKNELRQRTAIVAGGTVGFTVAVGGGVVVEGGGGFVVGTGTRVGIGALDPK